SFKEKNVHFDLDKARVLLKPYLKHAPKNGLRLMVKNSPEARQVGEFISSQLQKIGLTVSIDTLPFNRLVERANKGEYELFYLAWFVGIPFVEEFLSPFHSQSAYNRLHYKSSVMDQRLDQLVASDDLAIRQ